jgi:hypothetical protein
MFRRLALLAVAVLLSACAANQVNHDFDASRDFACNIAPMTHESRAT